LVGLASWLVLDPFDANPTEPSHGADSPTAPHGTRFEEPAGKFGVTPPAPPALPPSRPAYSEPPRRSRDKTHQEPYDAPPPVKTLPSASEMLRRANEATGLEGEALKKFHQDFMRGLTSFGPLPKPFSREDREDRRNDERARAYVVAEELLGAERGAAFVDALFGEDTDEERRLKTERGRRYMEAVNSGLDPEEAARAVGIIEDDAPRDAGP
jgi:hypothetical protein